MTTEVIGSATLYCGDAYEIVPECRFDSLVTDPPYGMKYQSGRRIVKYNKIKNDDSAAASVFAAGLHAPHSKYIFCRWDNLWFIPTPKSVITWVKNNWSSGDLRHAHGRQTELICFYPGPEHVFPGRRPADVVYADRTGNQHHPAEKPLALMRTVLGWTAGAVIDPFMGSGTTGVAAVAAGREFVGIEIDADYFDTACQRIEAVANQASLFSP